MRPSRPVVIRNYSLSSVSRSDLAAGKSGTYASRHEQYRLCALLLEEELSGGVADPNFVADHHGIMQMIQPDARRYAGTGRREFALHHIR